MLPHIFSIETYKKIKQKTKNKRTRSFDTVRTTTAGISGEKLLFFEIRSGL